MIGALARLHGFDPHDKEAAIVWDTIEEAQAFKAMTDGMKYFLGAVGLTTLFLGGLGVMNVMLVAVRERTREIGVRKAVGALSHNIMMQFFVETIIVVLRQRRAWAWRSHLDSALSSIYCPCRNILPDCCPTWQSGLLSVGSAGTGRDIRRRCIRRGRRGIDDPIEALRYEAGG